MPRVIERKCVAQQCSSKFKVIKKNDLSKKRKRLVLDVQAAQRMIGHACESVGVKSKNNKWIDLGKQILQMSKQHK